VLTDVELGRGGKGEARCARCRGRLLQRGQEQRCPNRVRLLQLLWWGSTVLCARLPGPAVAICVCVVNAKRPQGQRARACAGARVRCGHVAMGSHVGARVRCGHVASCSHVVHAIPCARGRKPSVSAISGSAVPSWLSVWVRRTPQTSAPRGNYFFHLFYSK
jgi:hypothetical protein